MRGTVRGLAIAALASGVAAAGTTTFVETFDGGSNVGGWTFGVPGSVEASGGNPGAYLAACRETFRRNRASHRTH